MYNVHCTYVLCSVYCVLLCHGAGEECEGEAAKVVN